MRRAIAAWAVLALSFVAASCASTSHETTDAVKRALRDRPPATPTTTVAPHTVECDPESDDAPLKSYPAIAPGSPLPAEMSNIYDEGYLVAGVDDNTVGFSSRNSEGQLEGLEVDIVHRIARAIFGDDDPRRVRLKAIVTAQKVPFARRGDVDLTVSAVSMSCDRWQEVAFSTEYFTATHKLLVPKGSSLDPGDPPEWRVDIDNLGEVLGGKRVCVTKGSSSVKLLEKKAPATQPVPVDARSDCLMNLQQGRVDAYLGHDSFMRGMVLQDPTVKIVPDAITEQHYGIAMRHTENEEFTRFVNGVLDEMRDDGTLLGLYQRWLGDDAPAPPPGDETRPIPVGARP